MTILERINLHKYGYTKAEIEALAAAEKEAQPAEEPELVVPDVQAPKMPESDNTAVLKAINDLTAAIQAQNVQTAKQAAPQPVTAEDVLAGALKSL